MYIELVMPSNHFIFCPLLLLPSIFSNIRFFSSELALSIRLLKFWSFSFSICPSNEFLGLISFRSDLFDLLAVHGILKNLLQHHSSKAPIHWCSAFFRVQLSHLYMTAGKAIALTIWTFVGKVMSRLFNMLSRVVIAFLPRSTRLWISWLQSLCCDFGAQEKKVCHCLHSSPFDLPWSDGTRYHDLSFFNGVLS